MITEYINYVPKKLLKFKIKYFVNAILINYTKINKCKVIFFFICRVLVIIKFYNFFSKHFYVVVMSVLKASLYGIILSSL